LFSFQQKGKRSIEAVQGVRMLVESYDLSTKGRVERLLLQKVHRVEESNILKYLKECYKECMQEFFGDLSLRVKARGGIVPLKYSKGDRIEVIS
jgi:hypothetical protein